MILDIRTFIENEKPFWHELESLLDMMETKGDSVLNVETSKRLCYLYERVSEDLSKILTFSGERELLTYLENLVSRAYSNVYFQEKRNLKFQPWKWIVFSFPNSFRRHFKAFALSFAVLLSGGCFGAFSVMLDSDAKTAIFPREFSHLYISPDKRVEHEEKTIEPANSGYQSSFAAQLMTHNIQMSVLCLALGVTWGIGTLLVLFYNGIILGAVALDFILGGHTVFMLGWLLPHGVLEIPAFLMAGQAGLMLGACLLKPVGKRKNALRENMEDIINLIGGAAMLLVWAGLVESFLSQLHEPFIPYYVKIGFGMLELAGLVAYLGLSGRIKEIGSNPETTAETETGP